MCLNMLGNKPGNVTIRKILFSFQLLCFSFQRINRHATPSAILTVKLYLKVRELVQQINE